MNYVFEVRFILDQHAELDLYSASSLKQQSAGRNVTPFGHIILIPSQPIFALINQKWILKEEDNLNSRKYHLAKYLTFLSFTLSFPL
jgi:hypothetical protein